HEGPGGRRAEDLRAPRLSVHVRVRGAHARLARGQSPAQARRPSVQPGAVRPRPRPHPPGNGRLPPQAPGGSDGIISAAMSILAEILMLLSGAATLPFVFSKRGPGPEGPVGMHMVTGPVALLGAVALGMAVHAGVWDFTWSARAAWYLALPGYVISM